MKTSLNNFFKRKKGYVILILEVEYMRDVITFLTSKEIIVVYIVAFIACFLAFIIYLVDKNYAKRKQKHNTKELNKLVEDVNLAIKEEEKSKSPQEESAPTPSVTPATMPSIIEPVNQVELLEDTSNVQPLTDNVVLESLNNLEAKEEPVIVKEEIISPTIADVPKKEEELQYTTIEPNVEQAKEQLRKLAIELEQEEQQEQPTIISNYEEEQETNAIISLEELVKKSKEMYAANELSQYKDEGNEPISLTDLEKAKKTNSAPYYDEPFIISNVVLDMEEEIKKENTKQLQITDFENYNVAATESLKPITENIEKTENAEKKDLYQTTKFKKSPVISPIYGIEKNEDDYLQLENTANYDKLDEEIRKTNEFLMTLKELQKNLD